MMDLYQETCGALDLYPETCDPYAAYSCDPCADTDPNSSSACVTTCDVTCCDLECEYPNLLWLADEVASISCILKEIESRDLSNSVVQGPVGPAGPAGPAGGSDVAVEDEGIELTPSATKLNFVGGGVIATNVGDDVTVTIPVSQVAVEDEGIPLTSGVSKFNFIGGGVTVTNPVADEVDVSIPLLDVDLATLQAGALTIPNVLTPASLGLISNLNLGTDQMAFGISAGNANSGNYQVAIGTFAGDNNTATDQIALGRDAGRNNTTADQIAIGRSAGQGADGGVCVGRDAGFQSDTQPVAIGPNAGYQSAKNVSGTLTAIGTSSGYKTIGNDNTFLGKSAGFEGAGGSPVPVTGDDNIGIGSDSCRGMVGNDNIFVGHDAGGLDGSGDGNIGIGVGACKADTGSFSGTRVIAIGDLAMSGASPGGTDVVALGRFAGKDNTQSNRLIIGNDNLPQFADGVTAAGVLPAPSVNSVYLYWDQANDCIRVGGGGTGNLNPGGDMSLASVQTVTGAKTFEDTALLLRNVADTFNGSFVNTNTADRVYTLPDASENLISSSSALGTGLQVLRTNAGATATEWATIATGGAFVADGDTHITPTTSIVLDNASGDEVSLSIPYTINKSGGSGDTFGISLDATETDLGSGSHTPFRVRIGGNEIFKVLEGSGTGTLVASGGTASRIGSSSNPDSITFPGGGTTIGGASGADLYVTPTSTWVGSDHSIGWKSTTDATLGTGDLRLHRDAANILALASISATTPQTFRIYNDNTAPPNPLSYERCKLGWNSNTFEIGTEQASRTDRDLKIFAAAGIIIGGAAADTIGLYDATPVAQHNSTGETVGFTAGAGTSVNDDSTFTGNVGAIAYRISDIVQALKNIGILDS